MRDDAFQRESLFDHQCNSDYKMLIVLKTNIFHFQMVVAQNKWTSLPNGDIWRLQAFFKPSNTFALKGTHKSTFLILCLQNAFQSERITF